MSEVNWIDKLMMKVIIKRLLRGLPKNINLKGVIIMPGWIKGLRTYILMAVTIIYNILAQQNIVLPDWASQGNAVIVIDFILGCLMALSNWIGRKETAKAGKVWNY